jgi:hypothetical protein
MNAGVESLGLEKQLLLDRSALCRLRLRRETHALRRSLEWKRASVAVAIVAAPAVRAIVWSVALSLLGAGRVGRMLMLAGRVVLVAKLARAAIDYTRRPAATAHNPP